MIDAIVQGLRDWLLGRIISMVVIGVVISSGLGLLNIPLALVLGVIAALLEFVPVLGPLVASVPGIFDRPDGSLPCRRFMSSCFTWWCNNWKVMC